MEEKTVLQIVSEIMIEQLGVKEETVKPDTHIIEDLGADSLDQVELVMAIEEEFALDVPEEDAEKWKTIEDVVTYLKDKTGRE